MPEHATWRDFFNAHAPFYDQHAYTRNTVVEVDFFLKLFPLGPGASILDVGCGTGRHAVELASRGYLVTGLDISAGMLEVASRRAADAGVSVTWMEADATAFSRPGEFDAAICLCEGGLGLLDMAEDGESHDLAILRNIATALRPHAPFLTTTLNGYSIIRQMKDEHVADGRFDPATMLAQYQDQWDLPEGTMLMTIRERLFIPPEMAKLLEQAGFVVDAIYGGTAGHWGMRPVSLDEIEAMYVCRRR